MEESGLRKTIAKVASVTGRGLHSGRAVSLCVRPGPSGSGIVFRIPGAGADGEFPARLSSVVADRNATSLGLDAYRVSTVEHLLACISMLGLDDLILEIEGGEPPAVDGSAAPLFDRLAAVGSCETTGERHVVRLVEEVKVRQGEVEVHAVPASAFGVDYTIDFDAEAIGRQTVSFPDIDGPLFRREIAPARTFGFLRDLDTLRAAGLAGGASLDNVVVVDGAEILNESGLRWPDEFVRHKVLDLVGDLALLGAPVRAHFRVVRGGHAAHHAWLRALRDRPDAWRLEKERR